MRYVRPLLTCCLLMVAIPAAAQSPTTSVKSTTTLPSPTILRDTIVISAFDIAPSSTGGEFLLRSTLLGVAPTGYRVSRYPDFRDAASFLSWPSSNVPVWRNPQTTGTCGANSIKVIGFYQVQGRKLSGVRVNSTVARDSLCILFG